MSIESKIVRPRRLGASSRALPMRRDRNPPVSAAAAAASAVGAGRAGDSNRRFMDSGVGMCAGRWADATMSFSTSRSGGDGGGDGGMGGDGGGDGGDGGNGGGGGRGGGGAFCEARREWRDAMRCESWRRPRPLPQKSDVFSAEWSSKRAATTNAVIVIGEGRTRCTC